MKQMGIQFSFLSVMKLLLQEIEKIVLIRFLPSNSGEVRLPLISPKRNEGAPQPTGPPLPSSQRCFFTDSSLSLSTYICISLSQFQVVNNLGSMIPRYIYAPIEEIGYNMFSKLQSMKDKQERTQQQLQLLDKVLKLVNIIGIFVLVFGLPLSETMLTLIYGDKWNHSSVVFAMECYCVYEYAMGVNGILEAFVTGTIDPTELGRYRLSVFISTVVYILVSIALASHGATGIIIANIISMVIRISICFVYLVRKQFNRGKLAPSTRRSELRRTEPEGGGGGHLQHKK